MKAPPELLKLLGDLPSNFFGSVEISIHNGRVGVVRVSETHNFNVNGRDRRSEQNEESSQSK